MSFTSYNSIYNITKENNNFYFIKGEKSYKYILNPGAYEIKEINLAGFEKALSF